MPHLIVYASESDLTGHEGELIAAMTDAVVAVYGDWARDIAVVQLIGLPDGRWGIGGKPVENPAPRVTFGIKEAAFSRPDAEQIVARLTSGVTEALVTVLGERVRPGTAVELVGVPAGRSSVGGKVDTT
jgi:phenylpyruvate tautomerase PptA (4-oxalocrotonate tautomerase family)